jgi:2-polyprenyl-3-methyl-5-hydroxy-6-metoxy-1,4-benzoquinol methylase
MTKATARCWCGNEDLLPFSDDYLRCAECETLVLARRPENLTSRIQDEDTELYGRSYYLRHLTEDYGYPDLESRMRADLPERCLHWLKTLLSYKSPGARTLELGCGHGASVALFRAAGYDATGLELSPWLVEFARKSWDIPVLAGPLEDQRIAPASLDAILAFDVLEHLTDPFATISAAVPLLKSDGILVLQTPCYAEGRTFQDFAGSKHPFLTHFKPAEHLYLFSETAARLLMQRVGLERVVFEPAIFAHYDQYFVASRTAFSARPLEPLTQAEQTTTPRRLVQALIDATEHRAEAHVVDSLRAQLAAAESDRADRLRVIHEQGRELTNVQRLVAETEADRNSWKTHAQGLAAENAAQREAQQDTSSQLRLLAQANSELHARLSAAETDREARLAVIHSQGDRLGELQRIVAETEADRDRWRETAEQLSTRVDPLQKLVAETEVNRDFWRGKADDAEAKLQSARADVANLEDQLANLGDQLANLTLRASACEQQLRVAETDRKARLVVIEDQGRQLAEIHALVAATEADRDYWRRQTEDLAREIDHIRAESHRHIDALDGRLIAAEADRAARLDVIHAQGAEIGRLQAAVRELEADRHLWSEKAGTLAQTLGEREVELEQRKGELARLEASLAEERNERFVLADQAASLQAQCEDLDRRLRASTAAGDLAHAKLGQLLEWKTRVQSHPLYRALRRLGLWPRL